jgi:hypothetical protein
MEGNQNFIPKPLEQKKETPGLNIHESSPVLENEATKTLKAQWERFWRLRSTKSENSSELNKDISFLKDGTLLHNLRYNEDALLKIMQSGILSGELGYEEKGTVAEDSETHYCADFFINKGDKSVAEYLKYAQGNEDNMGVLKKKRMESFSSPKEQNENISIVVDPTNPELAGLLEHSGTGIDTTHLSGFPVRFHDGKDKPEIAKRHLAVLVGIPANHISSLILGGKLAGDHDKVTKLKEVISSSGLDIPLLNHNGEKI